MLTAQRAFFFILISYTSIVHVIPELKVRPFKTINDTYTLTNTTNFNFIKRVK